MSSALTATMPINVSRPKVHRPPGLGTQPKKAKPLFPGFLLFWAAILLGLIMVSVCVNRQPVIKEATMLPEVAVVSERITPPAPATPAQAPAPAAAAVTEPSALAPIGDAQAATTTPPASTSNLPEKPGSTILLQDKSSTIVGQMAKIPLENEQITEVKPINDIDNGGSRELLSIVGKY